MADAPAPLYDVLGIGNAIVDVISSSDDAFLGSEGLTKGAMALIDSRPRRTALRPDGAGPRNQRRIGGEHARLLRQPWSQMRLHRARSPTTSSARCSRTISGPAGIDFDIAPRGGDIPTARCLILVTPDGQRTMNTYLGATQYLPERAIDPALIASAKILYLEG